MAASYVLTLLAQEDIDSQADRIEEDEAALRWVDGLHEALQRLGEMPGLGHARTDITDHDVRF